MSTVREEIDLAANILLQMCYVQSAPAIAATRSIKPTVATRTLTLFPPKAKEQVDQWIHHHMNALYPTMAQIEFFIQLAAREHKKLTVKQVRTYFANIRRPSRGYKVKGKGRKGPCRPL